MLTYMVVSVTMVTGILYLFSWWLIAIIIITYFNDISYGGKLVVATDFFSSSWISCHNYSEGMVQLEISEHFQGKTGTTETSTCSRLPTISTCLGAQL